MNISGTFGRRSKAEPVSAKGVMVMIKGLRGASIWSEDVKNLLPFYRDVLRLKVGFESAGFVVLGDLGAPALALGTHSGVRGRNADPARHMVSLAADDGRTDWQRVEAAGIEFGGGARDSDTLRSGTLRDPEGKQITG